MRTEVIARLHTEQSLVKNLQGCDANEPTTVYRL